MRCPRPVRISGKILIKAGLSRLLFPGLGLQDIGLLGRASWGGQKTLALTANPPTPDWRMWYFLSLLVFYLFLNMGPAKRGSSRG